MVKKMRVEQVKVNSKVNYYGKEYVIISIDPPMVAIKRANGDCEVVEIRFHDLVTNPSFIGGNELVKSVNNEMKRYMTSMDHLPEHKREQASARLEIIRPVLVLEKVKLRDERSIYEFIEYYGEFISSKEELDNLTQDELISRIASKRRLSKRTILRYLASYRKAETDKESMGIQALVSKLGRGYIERKDNRQLVICHPKNPLEVLDVVDVRQNVEYLPILKDVIEKEYLTIKKPNKSKIIEYINNRCQINNLRKLNDSTLYKLLNRIDKKVVLRMRHGKKASESFEDVERGYSNNDALYPLHIVEIDHTPLDMDVIDGTTGYNMGRSWITMRIDVYSRCIWCLYVSFEEPSANRVRKALQHGIFFKDTKKNFNTINNWEVFGIPNTIYLDNGSDFRSVNVKRMIEDTLQAHVRYRPRATPRYGGVIERLFGTVNSKLIHSLKGTRKSNVTELGEYDAEKEAILTIEDIIELLTIYITDIYHYSEHSGLPIDENIPMVRFIEGLKRVGYPEFVPKEQEEYYRIELLPSEGRPYTRDGLRFDNRIYKSDEFVKLIGSRDKKYKMKYDPDDISKVYVLHPEDNKYIELSAVKPNASEIKNMNMYTYKKLMEIMRQAGKEKAALVPGTEKVMDAKIQLQRKIEEKYKKNKGIRALANKANMQVSVSSNFNNNSAKKGEGSLADLINQAKTIHDKG
jgi:putative transposase